MSSAILTKSTDVVSKTNTYCRSVHFPLSQPFSSLCWQSAIQRCCGMRSSSSKKEKKRVLLLHKFNRATTRSFRREVCAQSLRFHTNLRIRLRSSLPVSLDHSDLFTLFPRVIHLLLEISSCLISTFPVHSTSFFLILSRLFPCLANAGCRVGPRNKMGHSAHQHKRFTRFSCSEPTECKYPPPPNPNTKKQQQKQTKNSW